MSEADLLSGFGRRKLLSVSQVNAMVRNTLESSFGELWVEGEISNYTRAASGHRYFTLKDERSQVRAVMFRGRGDALRFEPENGMLVVVRAALTVYEPRGEYQLNVLLLEPSGVGALQIAFEQLKKRLEAEGLFDPARKKPLPLLPQRLGIVTSPSGAAIRDILSVLRRRYPNIEVTIYPALVQGGEAPAQIVEGIEALDGMGRFDVLIVTRGGGSMEDLWAFNDERVARAIAACGTPVISAVGHEIDFTIADFVADLRAPTPSAAAEIVVGRKEDLLQAVGRLERRLATAVLAGMRQVRERLRALSPARILASLRALYQTSSQRTDDLGRRLGLGMTALGDSRRKQLARFATALEALSPLRALKRGYAIATRAGETAPLTSVAGVETGNALDLRLSDGCLGCNVTGIDKGEAS
jgi:exodeoxyribonuclease VII large subunit